MYVCNSVTICNPKPKPKPKQTKKTPSYPIQSHTLMLIHSKSSQSKNSLLVSRIQTNIHPFIPISISISIHPITVSKSKSKSNRSTQNLFLDSSQNLLSWLKTTLCLFSNGTRRVCFL